MQASPRWSSLLVRAGTLRPRPSPPAHALSLRHIVLSRLRRSGGKLGAQDIAQLDTVTRLTGLEPETPLWRPDTSTNNSVKAQQERRRRRQRLAAGAALGLVGVAAAAYAFAQAEDKPRLSFKHYVALELESVKPVTPETSIFRLKVPLEQVPLLDELPDGPIKALFVKQPELQIQRPYTPLDLQSLYKDGYVDLLVKRYPYGEVGRWMHSLRAGDTVSVRGPTVSWVYDAAAVDEVVFIVGGTGIAPVYQFLKSELGKPTCPKVTVVSSFPSPSRILLRDELDALQGAPDKLSITYFVDRLDEGQRKADKGVNVGLLDAKKLEKLVGKSAGRRAIVVCGPEPMVDYVAGPRSTRGPAPVGGLLAKTRIANSAEVTRL